MKERTNALIFTTQCGAKIYQVSNGDMFANLNGQTFPVKMSDSLSKARVNDPCPIQVVAEHMVNGDMDTSIAANCKCGKYIMAGYFKAHDL
jgi:hypothetical protein